MKCNIKKQFTTCQVQTASQQLHVNETCPLGEGGAESPKQVRQQSLL